MTQAENNKYFLLNRIHESGSVLNHHYTHEDKPLFGSENKEQDFTQGACLVSVSLCSPKPNADEAERWNCNILIHGHLHLPKHVPLNMFNLATPSSSRVLGEQENNLHPGFHVRPWLFD